MKQSYLFLALLLPLFQVSFSQNGNQPFKVRDDFEINGDIAIIGNQIVNREENKEKPNIPFNEVSEKARFNDRFVMKYVDVDTNDHTFSSSSATLALNSGKKRNLLRAGLYWSATYPHTFSEKKKENEFKITDKTRNIPNTVLLKIPSKDQYLHVEGTMVFDGFYAFSNLDFKGSEPYVAYADITHLIQDIHNFEGEYFVANILAANGEIKGGSCGGWAMVFIYEEEGASAKKITTHDGFTSVNTVLNYQINPKQNAKGRILGASIEGDLNVVGDKLVGNFPKNNISFFILEQGRSRDDFFNSSITKNNQHVKSRNPNSKNTLGFDIYDIEFSKYQQILTDEQELNLKLIAGADKPFLFFNAICIETEKNENGTYNRFGNSAETKEIDTFDVSAEMAKAGIGEDDIKNIEINNSDKGFYNVIGVYFNSKSVLKLIETLNKKGYETNYLFDDKTNYHYVYTHHSLSFDEALKNRDTLSRDPEIKESWILVIKNNN
ncbi:hypothetical protein [Capnocytophaga canimorsus]|uniref:hypothetical protein n=1 Tax=Capnocytophaga canimorsus TaxID=28188 RepID=UPI0037D43B72